ncbi:MAG: hypothetical protein ACE5FU_08895 [Nitrospinota bacterium]
MSLKISNTLPMCSFIEKKTKYGFALTFCLVLLFSSLAAAVVLYFMYSGKLTSGYSGAFLTLLEIKEFLTVSIVLTVLFQWVVVSVLTLLLTLFVSHKVAGPVYRFEQSLLKMKNGDRSENLYKIRAPDQVQPLSQALNEMSSAVAFKTGKIQNRTSEITHICGKISKSIAGDSSEDVRFIELSQEISRLKQVTAEAKEEMKKMFVFRNG